MLPGELLVALAALQAGTAPPHAREIEDLLRETGVRETLAALQGDAGLWAAVLDGVASGAPEWLAVGRELRRHSAGETSEGLDLALAEALLPAAEAVLRIADGTFWHVDDFCGTIGFAERGASDGELIAGFLDARRDALLRIADAELAERRDECVARLSEAREDLLGTGYE